MVALLAAGDKLDEIDRRALSFAKLAFEAELRASGLVWSIVRPTAFFKSLSGQVARVQAGKPFLVFGDGRLTACKPISDPDLGVFIDVGARARVPDFPGIDSIDYLTNQSADYIRSFSRNAATDNADAVTFRIHADGGAYKPLNWMNAPNSVHETESEWVVVNPKGEKLTITLHEVISDTEHALGEDPGLIKDGVEAHLQELLAAAHESARQRRWVQA